MTITKRLRWLHLSDVHFRDKVKLDQADAFARIEADVTKRKAAGAGPDLIFVTGDLAYSGQRAEFGDIATRLDRVCLASDLPRNRVFFCPGNHDIDCLAAPVLLKGCWASLRNTGALRTFLQTPEYAEIKRRQAEYRACVRDFRGDDAGFDGHELHAAFDVTIGQLHIGILSINSALLADGGPADHGRLQVCVRALEDLRGTLPEHHVAIALIHHPFEWLSPFEADRAEAVLLDVADIVLRGHLHQPKMASSLRGSIISAAGAVWEQNGCDYAYGFGRLALDTLSCEIESVRFVQQTGEWMHRSEEHLLTRNRDEQCTPAAIWAELRSELKCPAQIAAALSGFSGDLMAMSSGKPQYLSAERILAESVRSGNGSEPALGVMRVGTLLMIYGHSYLREVVRTEWASLREYDDALDAARSGNANFATELQAREAAAEKIAAATTKPSRSWSETLLSRLVAEGSAERILSLAEQGGDTFLNRLKAALSASRDPYEAWCTVQGPELDFGELATIATRLATPATADLAAAALADVSKRFPVESRRLDSVAKIIASELKDPNAYKEFVKAVRAK